MLSCEFCEISNNTFFYRTPLVAASELNHVSHFILALATYTVFSMVLGKFPPGQFPPIKWPPGTLANPNLTLDGENYRRGID